MPAPAVNTVSFSRRCRYGLETAGAWLLYGFFGLLPLDTASALGGRLFQALGPRLGISKVARRNLDLAYPDKPAAEKEAILRGMWNNLGRVLSEYPHLSRIRARIEQVGVENLEPLKGGNKPALFFSAHMANWELTVLQGGDGHDFNFVYRKPNNPGVDRLLAHARGTGGAGQISKGADGARQIVSVLRKGGLVGLLVDQKLNEGLPVPFFGVDAMTAPAIAYFALKFDCPIYPFRVERLKGCRFRATAYPPMEITRTGDKEADAKRILTDINHQVESWIRERPEQWLWLHRRWPSSVYTPGGLVRNKG